MRVPSSHLLSHHHGLIYAVLEFTIALKYLSIAETIQTALVQVARILNAELVGSLPRSNRILVPTGTLGANLWHSGDPIDLVCLSDNTAATFWAVVEEAFDVPPFEIPQDAALTLKCDSIKATFGTSVVTVRYCPFHPDYANQDPKWDGIFGFSARRSSAEERNRAMAFDTIEMNTRELLSSSSGIKDIFRVTYARLHSWFTINGLLHRPSGYMDSEALLCFLCTNLAARKYNNSNNEAMLDVPRMMEDFVQNATTDSRPGIILKTPQGRILSPHMTLSAIKATQDALAILSRSLPDLNTAFNISTDQAYRNFVMQMSIDSQLYAFSTESYNVKNSELYYFIDNLPSTLLAYLRKRPDLDHRIWPHPIIHINLNDSPGVYSTYIVAIKHRDDPSSFDMASIPFHAGDFLFRQALPGIFHTLTTITSPQSLLNDPCPPQPLQSLDLVTLTNCSNPLTSITHDPARPFRSAGKALSRALHDPVHQLTEYEVGYHDRFDGLLWIKLTEWGHKATEDEDFIPEHRVLKLRRVADGVVVWDREKRRDWL